MMPIFFEIMTIKNPLAEPLALVRIDTDKRVEGGCEAVVLSLHRSKEDAQRARASAKERATDYEH